MILKPRERIRSVVQLLFTVISGTRKNSHSVWLQFVTVLESSLFAKNERRKKVKRNEKKIIVGMENIKKIQL